MAVSTSDERVQQHVLQGWNHLIAAWDSEAYRHFSYAVTLDADCLMAQTGLAMSLLNCELDQLETRNRAIERCMALVEQGAGTDIERGYAFALSTIIQKNASAAATVFANIARRYPSDVLAKLLEAALRRRGYDRDQQPDPEQVMAEDIVSQLREQQPQRLLFQHAWLNLHSDAPQPQEQLKLAQQLAEQQADYPTVLHLFGHYLWRCGDFSAANVALGRASNLYGQWMKSNRLQPIDCPEWIRCEMYRAIALACMDDYDSALAIATPLAAINVSSNLASTASGRLLLWEAKCLPARLLLSRAREGDLDAALQSLPATEAINAMSNVSTVGALYQGLMLHIEGLRALQHNDLPRAQENGEQLGALLESIDQKQDKITRLRERRWIEPARLLLQTQWHVLRARIALAGSASRRSLAYPEISRACDSPLQGSFLSPPLHWTSLELERARYYSVMDRPEDALDVAQDAITHQPNDLGLLRFIEQTQRQLQRDQDADATRSKIQHLIAH